MLNLQTTRAGGKTLILVVDDDPIVRTMARHALESAGYAVIDAEDGRPAMDAYREHRPDAVLLDVLMKEVDGFEVCRYIRRTSIGQDVPVLIMTGLNDVASISSAYQAGATDFVTKPINYTLLRHRVEYLLRSSRAASDLRVSQERLAMAQRVARLGYWEWRGGSDRIYCSEECRQILNMDASEAEPAFRQFLSLVHPEDRRRVRKAMLAAIERNEEYKIQHRLLLADGTEKAVENDATVLPGEAGKPRRILGILRDTTDRWQVERRVKQLAYFDGVTGLPNRAFVLENLGRLVDAKVARGEQVVVLSVGIDHFRRVNNTLGYRAGNEVLQLAAERLLEVTGRLALGEQGDGAPPRVTVEIVARLTGDEFVLIYSHKEGMRHAQAVSAEVAKHLAEPIHIQGREISLTCSVGICLYPEDGSDAESALSSAAAAMYLAKKRGRNMMQVFQREWSQQAQFYLTIESELRHAIAQNQFVLVYQPKVNLDKNRVQGMEALIRWIHPTLGTISPVDFIPIAEQCGLIVPLGTWVLRTALEQLAQWNRAGWNQLRVSVNVSGAQLQHPGLDKLVADLLLETGVPAEQLELELTEGLLMEDTERNVALLERLTEMGVEVSVDDFGTGYSSLSYLTKFPVHTIKVDRAFVRDITTNRGNAAIVGATIALAHSLRLQVVAEGVETQPELDFLRGLRCDAVQGYFFSKPLPAKEFFEFVQNFGRQADLRVA